MDIKIINEQRSALMTKISELAKRGDLNKEEKISFDKMADELTTLNADATRAQRAADTVTNNISFNSVYDPSTASLIPGFNSGLYCDSFTTSSSPITFNNNDIFNADQLQDGDCKLSSGNLSVDPQFLNPSASDFHTQPTSPIVATGTITAPDIPPADLDAKAHCLQHD